MYVCLCLDYGLPEFITETTIMVYVEIQLEDIDIHQISRTRYNRRRHIDVNNIKICRFLKENRFAVKMIETFFFT